MKAKLINDLKEMFPSEKYKQELIDKIFENSNLYSTILLTGVSVFYENQEKALEFIAECLDSKHNHPGNLNALLLYQGEKRVFKKREENGIKRTISLLEAAVYAQLDGRGCYNHKFGKNLNNIYREPTSGSWENGIGHLEK